MILEVIEMGGCGVKCEWEMVVDVFGEFDMFFLFNNMVL